MPLSPLASTHGGTTSGMASHHRLWTPCTYGRRRAWHSIIAFGQHTWSNNFGRGTISPLLGSTHGQMSGVACHHRPWIAHTVKRCRAWHAITALGRHTRSNDIGRGMTLPPLDSTHGPMTFGVASHHNPWTTRTARRCQAWHEITALGQHTWSTDVGRGIQS